MRSGARRKKLTVAAAFVLTAAFVATMLPSRADATIRCSPGSCITAFDDEYTFTFDPAGKPVKVTRDNGVLVNDRGPNDTVVSVRDSDTETWWSGAEISINQYGAFTYKPDAAFPFTGIDTFDYTIRTPSGEYDDFATVTINVVPTIGNDSYVAVAGETLHVAAPNGLLGNDFGVDNTSLSADGYTFENGDLDVAEDGSFSYLPPNGFTGIDTFEYTVWDLNGDNDYTGLVTLVVTGDSGVPGVPAIGPAHARDAGAEVTWTLPSDSAVTSYTVTPLPSGTAVTVPGTESHAFVPGLTNGTPTTFTVTATNAAGTSGPSAPSNVVIPGPTIAIGDRMTNEGPAGKRTVTFPVTLSSPSTTEVAVDFTVTNGSAIAAAKPGAGADLRARDGTVRFKPNKTGLTPVSKTISVTIFGDTEAEGDETFTVELRNPTAGYTLAKGTGVGTIVDDDDIASLTATLGDASIPTSRTKKVSATLVVGLSAPTGEPLTLRYTVNPQTAGHSAKADGTGWYGGKQTATFTIRAGARADTIRVPIWAQPLRDPATFGVTLSVEHGTVALVRPSAVVTVLPQ